MTSRITVLLLLAVLAFSSPSLHAAAKSPDYGRLIRQSLWGSTNESLTAEEKLSDSRDPAAVAALLDGLKARDSRIRCECAKLLGERGDAGMAPALVPLLQDKDTAVRQQALRALGELRDPATLPAVARMLQDRDEPTRALAAFELGNFGGAAVEILTQALGHDDEAVRMEAVCSLGNTKDPRAVAPLTAQLSNAELAMYAIAALGEIGPPAIDVLLGALADNRPIMRRVVVSQLARINDPRARDVIYAACSDADARVRGEAVCHLRLTEAKERDLLYAALRDPKPEVRKNALQRFDYAVLDQRDVDALLLLLSDSNQSLCQLAAQRLSRIHDPRLVEPLLARLRQPNCPVEVVEALGKQRSLLAVPALIELLVATAPSEDRPGLGSVAVRALVDTGVPAIEPLLAVLRTGQPPVRKCAAEALGGLNSSQIVPTLLAALQDEDRDVRLAVIRALGEQGDARAWDPLMLLLADKDAEIRRSAAWALASCRDPRMIEPLTKMFRSHDPAERMTAVELLGRLDDPRVPPLMVQALKDRDDDVVECAVQADGPWVNDPRALEALIAAVKPGLGYDVLKRLAAADAAVAVPALLKAATSHNKWIRLSTLEALRRHRGPAVTAVLLAALSDRDEEVRWMACEVLAEAKDPLVVSAITQRLVATTNLEMRSELIWLLGQFGPSTAQTLLELLPATERPNERDQIVLALGATRSPAALDTLLAEVNHPDPYIRAAIADELGEFGVPRAVDALIALLRDKDSDVVRDAAMALGVLKDRRAVEPLLAALAAHRQESMAGAILQALQAIGDPRAWEVALPYLDDAIALTAHDEDNLGLVLPDAFRLIAQYGNTQDKARLAALLERYLYDTRPGFAEARGALVEVLATGHAEQVEPLLIAAFWEDLYAGDPTGAAEALARLDTPRAADALCAGLQVLRNEHGEKVQIIGRCLGRMTQMPRARLELMLRSDNWRARQAALAAMAVRGEAWAVPLAKTALTDPQPQVREAAKAALAAIGE